MKETWKFLWQMAFLMAIFLASNWFVGATGLPIPGNVLGIIVLFLLLLTGVVKEDHISTAADFLLKHMVFLFVPVAVGLMQWGGVFYDYGWILLAAIVVGAVLPLLTVGVLGRAMRRRTRRKEDESCSPM
ncbi:CidA/LrgA family protein [Desulfovibrio sp.]|uniref:CidA/LrgA family protein n=1 Tax=Desulfovibrio sp. TaxID=885 RepID=UPI0025C03AA2|nr:CidA/LrgA family protein [Desulfovibrio sp.]